MHIFLDFTITDKTLNTTCGIIALTRPMAVAHGKDNIYPCTVPTEVREPMRQVLPQVRFL